MKESLWGYWIIVLSLGILSVMILMQSETTSSEQDYYLIKSILESSMYEAVDYGYFSDTSRYRINAEKAVENFVRRFAESVNINKDYEINFYDIYEDPPYIAVEVITKAENNNNPDDVDVTNRIAGILYTTGFFKASNDNLLIPDPIISNMIGS